jgi:hypothetical protein
MGRLAALKELGRPDTREIEALANNRLMSLIDLDKENARLIAKLRGYVLAGSVEGPGVLKHNGTVSARGLNRETYKPKDRYPFVPGENGDWKRAKGRLRIEDWATRLPPKVCEACGHLFVTGRRDARTCSPRCRTALYRKGRRARRDAPEKRSLKVEPCIALADR